MMECLFDLYYSSFPIVAILDVSKANLKRLPQAIAVFVRDLLIGNSTVKL